MFKIINALPAALLAACMLAMHEVKGAPVASIDNPDEPATVSVIPLRPHLQLP